MILYKIQDSILMSPAKRDRIIIVSLIAALVINIVLWVLLLFNFIGGSQYIVLGYNIYFGISSFGPWYNVFFMPVLALLVILLNFSLSFSVYLKEKIMSYFLSFVALLFNVIMFLAALIIIYVNI